MEANLSICYCILTPIQWARMGPVLVGAAVTYSNLQLEHLPQTQETDLDVPLHEGSNQCWVFWVNRVRSKCWFVRGAALACGSEACEFVLSQSNVNEVGSADNARMYANNLS